MPDTNTPPPDAASAGRPDEWSTPATGDARGCYPCDTCEGFRAIGSPCAFCLGNRAALLARLARAESALREADALLGDARKCVALVNTNGYYDNWLARCVALLATLGEGEGGVR